MNPLRPRTYIIAAAIGVVTIAGAFIYLEYEKLKQYCLSVKSIKLNSFNITGIDIDLILNFVNKSKFALTLFSQEYLVYMNDSFVTKISNAIPQNIKPLSTSQLTVKLQFNPQTALSVLQANISNILNKSSAVNIKITMNVKVGIGIFKFNIISDYLTTLKEITSSSNPNNSANKC